MKKYIFTLLVLLSLPLRGKATDLQTLYGASPTYGYFTLQTSGTGTFQYPFNEDLSSTGCIFEIYQGAYPSTSTFAGSSSGSSKCSITLQGINMNNYLSGSGTYWLWAINPYVGNGKELMYYAPLINLASGSWQYVYSPFGGLPATATTDWNLPDWGWFNPARDMLVWAILPSKDLIISNMQEFNDIAETKVPFAYALEIYNTFTTMSTGTASGYPVYYINNPFGSTGTMKILDMGIIPDYIGVSNYEDLQTILIYLIWIGVFFYIFNKITNNNSLKL